MNLPPITIERTEGAWRVEVGRHSATLDDEGRLTVRFEPPKEPT